MDRMDLEGTPDHRACHPYLSFMIGKNLFLKGFKCDFSISKQNLLKVAIKEIGYRKSFGNFFKTLFQKAI